jgi:hypothetical protein
MGWSFQNIPPKKFGCAMTAAAAVPNWESGQTLRFDYPLLGLQILWNGISGM